MIEVSKNIFKKNRNIILRVIYRSPDSQLSMFNESLEHILIQIDNGKIIAYLSGDYNVNTADVLSCKSQTIHDFINIYSSFHYHKFINQPTRIILHKNSIKTATLIDNIYTNQLFYFGIYNKYVVYIKLVLLKWNFPYWKRVYQCIHLLI